MFLGLLLIGAVAEYLEIGLDVDAHLLQAYRELCPSVDNHFQRLGGCAGQWMPPGPLTDRTLHAGFVQGDVLAAAGCIEFDLIEMEVVAARQLKTDKPGPSAIQGDIQGFFVAMPEEDAAIVLINHFECFAVLRNQDGQARGPQRETFAIVDEQAIQRDRVPEVHLPPRLSLVLGMEAPLAVYDPVTGTGGILRRSDT